MAGSFLKQGDASRESGARLVSETLDGKWQLPSMSRLVLLSPV